MSTGSMDIIGGAIAGGSGISEIVAGIIGTNKSQDAIRKLRKEYPNMDIPTAITMATELARQDAQRTRLPGQDLYESQIQQSTAQGISASREAATSAADVLGATTSLYGQQSQAMTNLQIEAARQQAANRQRYGQQLNTLGQWQQQQYYMNEYYPWQAEMAQAQGNLQSSYDMLTGGISTLAGSGYGMTSNIDSSGMTQQTQQTALDQNAYNNAMSANINYQGSTPLMTNQSMSQYQYNPQGNQTLGQYQYNPNNEMTLSQWMYQ